MADRSTLSPQGADTPRRLGRNPTLGDVQARGPKIDLEGVCGHTHRLVAIFVLPVSTTFFLDAVLRAPPRLPGARQ